jgi:hypothetical protein
MYKKILAQPKNALVNTSQIWKRMQAIKRACSYQSMRHPQFYIFYNFKIFKLRSTKEQMPALVILKTHKASQGVVNFYNAAVLTRDHTILAPWQLSTYSMKYGCALAA